ncbi:DEAD/DEAH box helicase [Synechococcus sp. CCY9201]|uniref:DEAD/DEAH box helicase n=1 Tax=Synechococcus sp. CCY9201 TaxID=174697 RepID=UPI002B214E03|nr:DEAD/DEAH box helicase [Synechococcus sp. CCY9201]MEA5474527.1 DEAD/DEAH box helicase [Synechococcus sp. CCY9201]
MGATGSPRSRCRSPPTGTGSGKTECFLLPLLEHCRLQHAQGQRGIKAILIYPMNALATDQARRIADLIHTISALAGLRAGLYIGASDDAPTVAMSATSMITDKDALHKAPPNTLLTNYKQLDYLLLQPHVQSLWEHNGQLPDGTSVLRYLVVDDFHTYMTDESKALTNRTAVSALVVPLVFVVFRSLVPWVLVGLVTWWIWKAVSK